MNPAELDLRHYTSKPLGEIRPVPQDGRRLKPWGLWVSVGTAWLDWCRKNHWGRPSGGPTEHSWLAYRITLDPEASIKVVETKQETRDLIEEYSVSYHPEVSSRTLNWPALAEKYDGILLTRYYYDPELRMSHEALWYYGWDCASGCLWGGQAAVAQVELIEWSAEARSA